ncbi:hypothetical protein niasHT_019852 [Heterodera trifolii]|uniref:Uncharacterized protein n=1 Tax=Heterodera trifolii TaxID=157864 RepID=A0ABD2KUW1_9BILA
MLLFPTLFFIFFSAFFIGSVQPNGGHVEFVEGFVDKSSQYKLNEKIAQGYEIVSVTNAGEKVYLGAKFLWTLLKKNNNNDDQQQKNNQIDALGQKIVDQQKIVGTLVEQIKTLDGKLVTLEKRLEKKNQKNNQIDALGQKIVDQQKTVDTLVEQIKILDGKLVTLEQRLEKKDVELMLF